MSLAWYLILAGVLFAIGATTFSRINSNIDGQIMAFFVMVVAAAEVVVGLSIIVSIYRSRSTTSMDDLNLLKN